MSRVTARAARWRASAQCRARAIASCRGQERSGRGCRGAALASLARGLERRAPGCAGGSEWASCRARDKAERRGGCRAGRSQGGTRRSERAKRRPLLPPSPPPPRWPRDRRTAAGADEARARVAEAGAAGAGADVPPPKRPPKTALAPPADAAGSSGGGGGFGLPPRFSIAASNPPDPWEWCATTHGHDAWRTESANETNRAEQHRDDARNLGRRDSTEARAARRRRPPSREGETAQRQPPSGARDPGGQSRCPPNPKPNAGGLAIARARGSAGARRRQGWTVRRLHRGHQRRRPARLAGRGGDAGRCRAAVVRERSAEARRDAL